MSSVVVGLFAGVALLASMAMAAELAALTIEAEETAIEGGKVVEAKDASSGKAVLTERREAAVTWTKALDRAVYQLTVRALAPDKGTDSLWIELDGKRQKGCIDLAEGVWTTACASLMIDKAGPHKVTLRLREAPGMLIDWVRLSIAMEMGALAHDDPDEPAITRIFDVLNLEYPGLMDVKRLHDGGDDKAARVAIRDYFRARKYWRTPETREPKYADPIADDLLRNVFHMYGHEVYFGPDVSQIGWYTPPEDVRLMYCNRLGRHNVVAPALTNAYWHTRDERYARKLAEIIEDFIRSCPVVDAKAVADNATWEPPADEDGDGKPDRPGFAGVMWKPFVIGRRVQNWERLFSHCRDSDAFTPELWCEILCSIDEQIGAMAEKLPGIRQSNHGTRMADLTFEFSLYWPELAGAPHWQRAGVRQLAARFNWTTQGGFVCPDGATREISQEVSLGDLGMLGGEIERMRANGIEVPANMLAVHEKMSEYELGILYPSQVTSGRFAGYGERAARLHARRDLLYIATAGKRGEEPKFTSYPYRLDEPSYAGTYFMRSGWDSTARVLRVRFGPIQYKYSMFGLGDVGDVGVWGFGMHLIPHLDKHPSRGPFRPYGDRSFCGDGRSENTISVDAVGQSSCGRLRLGGKSVDSPWITCPVYGYVRGSYRFDPKTADVTHTRAILFVRPDYFVVIDRLLPRDEVEHEYRMKYQLHKDLAPSVEGTRVTAVAKKQAGIVVAPSRDDLKLEIIKGQKEPCYEGWHMTSVKAGEPAPALIYTWADRGASGVETVLYPVRGDAALRVQVGTHRGQDGSTVLKITGHAQDTTDYVLVGGESSSANAFDLALRGALGFVRVRNGTLVSAGLVEGESLTGDALSFRFERPASAWVRRARDGHYQTSASEEGTVLAAGVRPPTVQWPGSAGGTTE